MAPDTTSKSARAGLSLYANLLDPSSNKNAPAGTISRPPVVFKQPAGEDLPQDKVAAEKQQISAGRSKPTSVSACHNSGFVLAHTLHPVA